MNTNNNFIKYLLELRRRLLYCCGALLISFSVLFYFSKTLFALLAVPLIKHLPENSTLIATTITAPLFTPLKFSFLLAVALSIPYFLYQLWAFIMPALYKREQRLMWFLLAPGIILFYIGVSFAYFIVFPLIFKFFAGFVPEGVLLLPDITQYLDFTMKLFLAFGIVFEVPVITIALVLCHIATPKQLSQFRPYVIVIAFIVGMLLTPPELLSQVLLAVPICVLYEIGILLSRLLKTEESSADSL